MTFQSFDWKLYNERYFLVNYEMKVQQFASFRLMKCFMKMKKWRKRVLKRKGCIEMKIYLVLAANKFIY